MKKCPKCGREINYSSAGVPYTTGMNDHNGKYSKMCDMCASRLMNDFIKAYMKKAKRK